MNSFSERARHRRVHDQRARARADAGDRREIALVVVRHLRVQRRRRSRWMRCCIETACIRRPATLAANAAPTVPPAPDRLSTSTCWPHIRLNRSVMSRAMMSGEAPAGKRYDVADGLGGIALRVGPKARACESDRDAERNDAGHGLLLCPRRYHPPVMEKRPRGRWRNVVGAAARVRLRATLQHQNRYSNPRLKTSRSSLPVVSPPTPS